MINLESDALLGDLQEALDHDDAKFCVMLREFVFLTVGFSLISQKKRLNRQTLSRALSEKGNPSFRAILSVLDVLGLRLKIEWKQDL